MELSIFNANHSLHTVGTSYYYSSYHYLGYSPYSGSISEDVKPNIIWVSRINQYFFVSVCSKPTPRIRSVCT